MIIQVKDRTLSTTSAERCISDNKDYKVHFVFDEEWEGTTKTARFISNKKYKDVLIDSEDECDIPVEILTPGILKIGVYNSQYATTELIVTVLPSVLREFANAVDYISEDLYREILKKIDGIQIGEVSKEQIYEAVEQYLTENPPSGEVSTEEIKNAVTEYLTANPPSGVTETDIVNAVNAYMEANAENFKGEPGEPGENGVTPNLTIGTVETLAAGSSATASIEGTAENPVLILGIPQGAKGKDGASGSGGSEATVLDGEKIGIVGDSITFGTGSSAATTECDGYYNIYNHKMSYPEILKEQNPSATIYNYGMAGLAVGRNTSNTTCLLDVLESMHTDREDLDYVVLSGGVNDSWVAGTTFGEITSGFADEVDENTFYGALESYIRNAISFYPNAYILYVMTHNNVLKKYGDDSAQSDLNEAIRNVCKKYKIRLLDLNKDIGVNLYMEPYSSKYMADNTHPNEQCYRKYYAPLVEEALLAFGRDTSTPVTTGEVTLSSISATKGTTTYTNGDTLETNDITVTATYTDNSTKNITSLATFDTASVDMANAGTYNLVVSYTENSVTKTCTIVITVEESGGGEIERTVLDSGTIQSTTTWTNTVTWTMYSDGELVIGGTGNPKTFSTSDLPPWNAYASRIKKVTYEEGVTGTGSIVFYNDYPNIIEVTFPSTFTTIGNLAFYKCTGLTSITIPAAVATISANAFQLCDNLTDMYCGFSEGAVANAPWGATGATIHYDYTE